MLVSLIWSALLASCVASPAERTQRRNLISASEIVAAVDGIDTGVNQLKTDLEAYQGGLLAQTPILGAFAVIEVANRAGYAEALLASDFSAAGSDAIVQAVNTTVAVDIPACIAVLKSKKALFDAEDESSLIVGSLEILLYDHESFSDAVLAHLTSDYDAGVAAVDVIIDAIQSGIDYYSS